MPRMTKEERAELEARLRDDDDADDDSDEVEIGFSDGSYFRGTARRARQLGHIKDPDPAPAAGDGKPAGKTGNVRPAHFGGRQQRSS